MNDQEPLRYPIGRFIAKAHYDPQDNHENILSIKSLPDKLERLVKSFSAEKWDTPYRPGGWTAQQVVHHIADSHMNAYIRMKWALTEGTPVIKAYDEKAWAETPETRVDHHISLALLHALHTKWTTLMEALTNEDLKREFIHPETQKHIPLDRVIATYAWHGEHHLGHLKIIETSAAV